MRRLYALLLALSMLPGLVVGVISAILFFGFAVGFMLVKDEIDGLSDKKEKS